MITSINEFRQLNENRYKIVYYKVTNPFRLLDKDGWDVNFPKDQIIEVDPNNGTVKSFNEETKRWDDKGLEYREPINQEFYNIFKENTVKVEKGEIAGILRMPTMAEFQTTVRKFQQKADEMGLEPDDSIRVRLYRKAR
jgi:hypothetical protein